MNKTTFFSCQSFPDAQQGCPRLKQQSHCISFLLCLYSSERNGLTVNGLVMSAARRLHSAALLPAAFRLE